jgi:hypothetical protein
MWATALPSKRGWDGLPLYSGIAWWIFYRDVVADLANSASLLGTSRRVRPAHQQLIHHQLQPL